MWWGLLLTFLTMENIKEKAQDDQDFLYGYGSIRSRISSNEYRQNYDRIFKGGSLLDQGNLVDPSSPGEVEKK